MIVKRNAPTMHDVARLAGVSISTVSAVVNERPIVSPDLHAAVQKAIKALGYSPNVGARGLRSGRTKILGFVVPDIANPFFVGALRGVEDEGVKHGYEVIVYNSNDQPELELRHLKALYAQRADGILLAPADSYAAREMWMQHGQSPLVYVDCVPMKANVNCVVTDNYNASYEAIRYLIGLGHQKIAIISGRLVHSTSIDRVDGCRRAMQEANLPVREEALREGDSHIESGYQIGLNLLQSTDPPTAIFALNNRMGLGVLRAIRELAVPCPEKVSVLTFDDPDWAEVFSPSLTAIEQPTFELGKAAVQMLMEAIEADQKGTEFEPHKLVLKSTLHVRNSTAPPGVS